MCLRALPKRVGVRPPWKLEETRAPGYTVGVRTLITVLVLLVGLGAADARKKRPHRAARAPAGPQWHQLDEPLDGQPEVVGSYAGGCIVGAVPVPAEGVGFETIRRWRNRFYAHPRLADWLADFGRRVRAAGLPDVLVGDISQPRGGRMRSGHRSHQVGLDADIWFTRPPADQRDSDGAFVSLVDHEAINRNVFAPNHVEVLKLAAAAPEVERIFVNWVIKKELCAAPEGERAWLHKVRPWYGHDSHFHVRLRCPPDSPQCRPQSPLSKGDGCGEEAWFSRAAAVERRKAAKAGKAVASNRRPGRRPGHTDVTRERCAEVLAAAAHPGGGVATARRKPGHGGAGRSAASPPK